MQNYTPLLILFIAFLVSIAVGFLIWNAFKINLKIKTKFRIVFILLTILLIILWSLLWFPISFLFESHAHYPSALLAPLIIFELFNYKESKFNPFEESNLSLFTIPALVYWLFLVIFIVLEYKALKKYYKNKYTI